MPSPPKLRYFWNHLVKIILFFLFECGTTFFARLILSVSFFAATENPYVFGNGPSPD